MTKDLSDSPKDWNMLNPSCDDAEIIWALIQYKDVILPNPIVEIRRS